ncbi:MAG: right-handed parallel beta-helix repeat-containing protein [Desulfurococcaceae archaeon]
MAEGRNILWGLLGIGAAVGTSTWMVNELRKQLYEEINRKIEEITKETRKFTIEPSYIVYKEGDTIYVRNGINGQVEASGAGASEMIQYAINKVSEQGGGKVLIKAGSYTLTTELYMKSNVVLEGEGRGTVLKGKNLLFTDEGLENVVVRNLFIDNREVGNCIWLAPPGGVSRWGPSNVLLENLILYGSGSVSVGHSAVEVRSARRIIIRNCEIAYGGHNGIYIDRVGEGFEPTDIFIQGCYIHDNYDDAIDPNYTRGLFVIGNYIKNNELSCCSIENNCMDVVFAGNYVIEGRFINIFDSSRVLIASNYFYITFPGEYAWKNSSFIAFIGNFYGPMAYIRIGGEGAPCHSVSVIGNHLWNSIYNQICIRVTDSRGFAIKNNYINTWDLNTNRTDYVHPFIIEGAANDYEISGNFIECYDMCRAKFVGNRYRVFGNTVNRRGYWIITAFHDYDGTMTGTAGTAFTFEPQQGVVTGIDTGTTGVKSGTVNFPVRYPIGKVPRVMVSLLNVSPEVRIDTIYVSDVTETGFTWNLNVANAVTGTTCSLVWRAALE